MSEERYAARLAGVSVDMGGRRIVDGVSLALPRDGISVLMGRSGSGKTTLLRTLNRLNDELPRSHVSGRIDLLLGGSMRCVQTVEPVPVVPVSELRRRVGMVFQTPRVFPVSIRKNMALPLDVIARRPRAEWDDRIREALVGVDLWDEVRSRMDMPADRLSGGQQQRLCLARALVLEPDILLVDEPTASLDVHATRHIEDLLLRYVEKMPIVMVSHSPTQGLRLAKTLVVMDNGVVTEVIGDPQGMSVSELEASFCRGAALS